MIKLSIYILFILISLIINTGISHAEFSVYPRLSFIEGYSDNITNTGEKKKASFSSIISPGADIGIISKRMNVNVGHTTGFERYYRYPEFNNITHNTSLSGQIIPSSRSVLNINNRFNLSQGANIEDNYAGVRNSFTKDRQKRVFNNLDTILSYTVKERFVFNLNYMNYYEDVNIAYEFDEKHNRYGGGVTYNISDKDSFNIDLSHSLYRFFENDIIFKAERGFNTSSLDSGYTHRFKTGAFSFSFGGNMNNYINNNMKDELLYVMGVKANKYYEYIRADILYKRDVVSGGGFGGGALEETYTLNIGFVPSPKLTISLNGAYSNNKFFNKETSYYNIKDNQVYRSGISSRYNLSVWCAIEAGYTLSFYNYDSDPVKGPFDFNYSQSYGGINFTLSKDIGLNITYKYLNRALEDKTKITGNEEYVTNTVNLSLIYKPNVLK